MIYEKTVCYLGYYKVAATACSKERGGMVGDIAECIGWNCFHCHTSFHSVQGKTGVHIV